MQSLSVLNARGYVIRVSAQLFSLKGLLEPASGIQSLSIKMMLIIRRYELSEVEKGQLVDMSVELWSPVCSSSHHFRGPEK